VRLPLKSPTVAAWFFACAFLVIVMVFLGGATRLTQSGLSITEWKPISGIMPPDSDTAWNAEFANYKKIPQFSQINPHMTLEEFKGIFWWEWAHRIVGRVLVGLVLVLPYIFFLLRKEIPGRIIWRGAVAVGLGGLQGLVGWLMVASGLTKRFFVAPEMLMAHLGMALILLIWSVWSGLETYEGEPRGRGASFGWRAAAGVLLGLIVFQCLLGSLVAGNQAGLVYNDWPGMNGHIAPFVDWSKGVAYNFFYDQGLVQFVHRTNAYIVLIYAIAFAVLLSSRCQDDTIKNLSTAVAVGVILQATLGVLTLLTVVNIVLALLHQLVAACLVILAAILAWNIARADRAFRRTGF
jgi:cytochrome c oxidase assembly protein subunit 15